MAKAPLISVITPCLNGMPHVTEAVESVLAQNYSNFEHIVVDGGSTDGTLDVLENDYDHVQVQVEEDSNIFEATNTAIELSDGDFIAWLNADDLFAKGVFHQFAELHEENRDAEMICGESVEFLRKNGEIEYIKHHSFPSKQQFHEGQVGVSTHINDAFFSRELLNRVGPLDTDFKISSDLDYLIRLSLAKPNMVVSEEVFQLIRRHEDSFTFNPDDQSDVIDRVSNANFVICERYMNSPNVPPKLRKFCRTIYRLKLLLKGRDQLLNRVDLSGALKTFFQSFETGWTGPLWILGQIVKRPFKILFSDKDHQQTIKHSEFEFPDLS